MSVARASAAEQMVPALRPAISLIDHEGVTLIAAEVEELPRNQKPCYVRNKGMEHGSYLRVGESDRRLTSEEVQQLTAERGQPRFDHEPVPDINPKTAEHWLGRLKQEGLVESTVAGHGHRDTRYRLTPTARKQNTPFQ
ncbi:hypothetical protein [Frankia sp. Cas4]|uniref:hypothetical protein n=1 Tax=Frankia sp. Cas4 TaxID=3073927 RepID=UPI002AD4355B|nr:hypothetical protein [Frankia sp. Cas4]